VRYPLNITLPLFILVVGMMASAILMYMQAGRELADKRAETELLTLTLGSIATGELSYALRSGLRTEPQRVLDRLKFDRSLALAIYVDDQDRVLLSTDYGRAITSWRESAFAEVAGLADRARIDLQSRATTDAALENAFGIFPVHLTPGPTELATSRVGVLLLHRDVSREKRQLIRNSYGRFVTTVAIILAMSLAVWLFLRYALLGRIRHLAGVLEGSDPSTLGDHLTVTGHDEVGRIARASVRLSRRVREQTEALRDSEMRFRGTFEQAAVGIAHVSTAGHFLWVNPGLCRLLGYTEEELRARTFEDITHPDDVAQDRVYRQELLDDRAATFAREKRYVAKDGKTVWVSLTVTLVRRATGEPDYLVAVATDISERRRAESEREHFFKAVEQSGDMIVITDLDPRILYVNATYEEVTGYSRAEVIGENPGILKSGVHDTAFYEAMWRQLTAGERWEGQLVNRRKDGREFTAETSIAPVFDAGGNLVNYVSVSRDVTDEIALLEENRRLEERNRRSHKMEAIGTLAGGIAHDFNNILTIISGHCDLASLNLPTEHPANADLKGIRMATERAVALVSKILIFSRKSEEQRQPVYLEAALGEALDLLRPVLPSTIAITEHIQQKNLCIHADPTQLHQVILNLVTNAHHAIGHEPGRIRISLTQRDVGEDEAEQRHVKPGPHACLTVEDSGTGMDRDTMERIFDPFFTTKEVGKGTGLGLSTVHGIVHALRGTIGVSSRPGEGTRFELLFPCLQNPVELAEAMPRADATGGTEHVLVVDDEANIVAVNSRMLELAGYRVTAFVDSELALERLLQRPGQYDLVVTDLTMPKVTGLELARRMRAHGVNIPIIIATGYAENFASNELRELRHTTVLSKPFPRLRLLEVVRRALDTYRECRQAN